jgi:hypothetical protein
LESTSFSYILRSVGLRVALAELVLAVAMVGFAACAQETKHPAELGNCIATAASACSPVSGAGGGQSPEIDAGIGADATEEGAQTGSDTGLDSESGGRADTGIDAKFDTGMDSETEAESESGTDGGDTDAGDGQSE